MRVIVCGSRGWVNKRAVDERLAALPRDAVIVVGYDPDRRLPRGADRFAYHAARKLGLEVETHPARWHQHGPSAGFVRNEEMAGAGADLCIAFYDGASHGTADMIERALAHHIEVEVRT